MSKFTISINSRGIAVQPETTVAAALLEAGETVFRRSVSGQPRAALCGMGICYECRVTIDGIPYARSCQILCRPGMRIATG